MSYGGSFIIIAGKLYNKQKDGSYLLAEKGIVVGTRPDNQNARKTRSQIGLKSLDGGEAVTGHLNKKSPIKEPNVSRAQRTRQVLDN